MKNIFNMCGICLKTEDEFDQRPKKKDKRKTKDVNIQRSMDHYDQPNPLIEYEKQMQQEKILQQQILQKQQEQLALLEKQKQEQLRLQKIEEEKIQQEKLRQEMIKKQRIENDMKVRQELQIPQICLYEKYEPLDGELIDESSTTIQKKIYENQQYKLQTVTILDINQPQAYNDLFHAINTIQEAREMNMWNVQKIDKCNFYSIYNEDEPTYYLSTVMPSTVGDLVFLNDEIISGYNFKLNIKNKKAQKYQAFKELFEDLAKLHKHNEVIQSIEPKNIEYGFQSQTDINEISIQNTKLYFQNIANFEEETNDNIFHPKKNFFTHPAYMTYKRNEINRAQDIYSLCLTALVVDSYKNQDDVKITTNSFFETVEYFNDFESKTDFPKNFSNTKKIKILKQYGLEQSQKLLQEISNFYSLEDNTLDKLDNESDQEDQNTEIIRINQEDESQSKYDELNITRITEKNFEEGSLEEELKIEKRYQRVCGLNFNCYMFLGLNFDVEKIPSANSYVRILDYLLNNLNELSEESSEEIVVVKIQENSQDNQRSSEQKIEVIDNTLEVNSQLVKQNNRIVI